MPEDITDDFDGLIIEPVKGIGDVKFARCDMAYWSSWATAIKAKRFLELTGEIEKSGLNAIAKVEARARAKSVQVYLREVLDLASTPDGITKILSEAYTRAGGDPGKWPGILKRIGPGRQEQLVFDICSEPRPTSIELREALRELVKKAHKQPPAGIATMSDEELIAAARDYQPDEKKDEGGGDPLAGKPDAASSTA